MDGKGAESKGRIFNSRRCPCLRDERYPRSIRTGRRVAISVVRKDSVRIAKASDTKCIATIHYNDRAMGNRRFQEACRLTSSYFTLRSCSKRAEIATGKVKRNLKVDRCATRGVTRRKGAYRRVLRCFFASIDLRRIASVIVRGGRGKRWINRFLTGVLSRIVGCRWGTTILWWRRGGDISQSYNLLYHYCYTCEDLCVRGLPNGYRK